MHPKWGSDISGIMMGNIKDGYLIGAALAITLVWNLQWLHVLWFLRESGHGGEQLGCAWKSISAEKESSLWAALGLNKKSEKLPMWIYPRDTLGALINFLLAQGVPWTHRDDPQTSNTALCVGGHPLCQPGIQCSDSNHSPILSLFASILGTHLSLSHTKKPFY